jgi:hypothetical protein
MTADAINGIKSDLETQLGNKADLVDGVVPDNQAPGISVKKDTIVVNVMDHGAKGDGVTPDDAAIAAAIGIVNVNVNHGKVYFPPGQYLLNGSSALLLQSVGVIIEGAGPQATQIVIGSGFTAPEVFYITAKDCQVRNLTIIGQNTTTTSNPVCDGIKVYGARRTRVVDCEFWYINGYAFEALASTTDASGNPDGTMLNRLVIRQCAGGIHFLGNTVSGYAVNSFMTDIQIIQGGVTTGGSANLDNIRIEDSWDVLLANVMSWMSVGTGNCLHIVGNCAAIFVKTIDGLGPTTAACVLIEDNANGAPQNIQIEGGVVQQGLIGIQTKGFTTLVTILGTRVINNQTHGISIESGQPAVNLFGINFSSSGAGASGTNYDLNWSGSATGIVDSCRFSTNIVATGTAGVQASVNHGFAGQNVRYANVYFTGSGSSTSNQFTNTPSAVLSSFNGTYTFLAQTAFKSGFTAQGNASLQPSSASNTVMSSNTGGVAAFDSWRLDGNGNMNAGTGSAARDTTWGRQGTAQFGTPDSDVVIGLAGKGLRVKSGSNARVGTATLAAGTVTVANTSVTANTIILLGGNAPVTANAGALYVSSVTPGTGFTVKSTNAADTSKFGYHLVESI